VYDLGIVLLFVGVFIFLCYRINLIHELVFDEYYYVPSAQALFHHRPDTNFEHPMLAKWLIGVPFYFLGDAYSLSWRIMPLLFGFLGLVVTYIFGRKIGLSSLQSSVAVLMLLFSGSWYILARVAMLDIFIAVFTLISGFFLYLFLQKNNFSRDLATYRFFWLCYLSLAFAGAAAACKWTGFFVLFFFASLLIFYFNSSIKQFIFRFLFCVVLSVGVYAFINVAILGFNFGDFFSRNLKAGLYHVTVMNPDSLKDFPENREKLKLLGGGPRGVFIFLFYSRVYMFDNLHQGDFKEYGMSHNQLISTYFVTATIMLILVGTGYIIRFRQGVPMELPHPLFSPPFIFLYFFAFFLIFPWVLVSRIQYSFYYLPAFPFVILFSTYYLFKGVGWKLRTFLLLLYFGFALYWFPVWIPL
jgi:dolichyl-phosphate-mannose--protein O-mannosyl transferase